LVLVCLAGVVMSVVPVGAAAATWLQKDKLLPPEVRNQNNDGYAVAIDGDTLVTGAPGNWNDAGVGVGAVYVYTRGGGAWSLQTTITPPGGVTPYNFGSAVAIDGDTLVVGDPDADTVLGSATGFAAVYARSGSSWSLQATLTAPGGANGDMFGSSVAVDGERAVVGAPLSAAYVAAGGAAYVFQRTGTSWGAGQLLPASTIHASDYLGISVDIEGDTAVAGSSGDSSGAPYPGAGAVHVFVKTVAWVEQAKVRSPAPVAWAGLGRPVAISGDTIVAGADAEWAPAAYSGAAYVFVRSGSVWTQQQKLAASDSTESARFGQGVGLDGDRVVIGAWNATVGAVPKVGAAYVFARSGAVWAQEQKLAPSDAAGDDYFGHSVGLSGTTLISGALGNTNAKGSGAGAVYVYGAQEQTAITIRTSATSVRTGNVPILSGAVTPLSMIGKNIVVWVKKPGKSYYSYSSNRTVYNLGGNAVWQYKYYFKPGMAKGYYVFKAGVPGWPGFVTSMSPTTVTVRLR
jgi:hypothetical protein